VPFPSFFVVPHTAILADGDKAPCMSAEKPCCAYKLVSGDCCDESVWESSDFCILHIDLPEKGDPEFETIVKAKKARIQEKTDAGDQNRGLENCGRTSHPRRFAVKRQAMRADVAAERLLRKCSISWEAYRYLQERVHDQWLPDSARQQVRRIIKKIKVALHRQREYGWNSMDFKNECQSFAIIRASKCPVALVERRGRGTWRCSNFYSRR
jgi:hypothetical protein